VGADRGLRRYAQHGDKRRGQPPDSPTGGDRRHALSPPRLEIRRTHALDALLPGGGLTPAARAATLAALSRHRRSPAVQEHGCAVLRNLADDAGRRATLAAAGAGPAALAALREHAASAIVVPTRPPPGARNGARTPLRTGRREGARRGAKGRGGARRGAKGRELRRKGRRGQVEQALGAARRLAADPPCRAALVGAGAVRAVLGALERHGGGAADAARAEGVGALLALEGDEALVAEVAARLAAARCAPRQPPPPPPNPLVLSGHAASLTPY